MKVETVAIVDTNADPYVIDHPIPANDDATGSIKLIVSYIIDAWAEGIKAQKIQKEEPKKEISEKPVAAKEEPKKEVEKKPEVKKEKTVKTKKITKKTK